MKNVATYLGATRKDGTRILRPNEQVRPLWSLALRASSPRRAKELILMACAIQGGALERAFAAAPPRGRARKSKARS